MPNKNFLNRIKKFKKLFWKSSRKVDFLVVGAQKAGTSALNKYLKKHIEIGMGRRKELHFFDDEDFFSNANIEYSNYESRFDFSAKKKVYGEATPIYMYWEPSCKRIWEYNPNMKLIFILRNPIERAFSHWNMEFQKGNEKNDFAYCIRNEYQRAKESLPYQHRVYSYIDRGFYSKQIERFKEYFSDEQLLFIKYDEFKNQQQIVLHKIFNFLDVDVESYEFEFNWVKKLKKPTTISKIDREFLINIFESDIHKVEKKLDWNCNDWLV